MVYLPRECKTGSKLVKVPGSVCHGCYALKGMYRFKPVQEAQYRRLASLSSPLWVGAMALLINSKKSKEFRWHDSGDVQDEQQPAKIFCSCKLTRPVTGCQQNEAWVKSFLPLCPDNLIIRFSGQFVDQEPVKSWPHTSTVSSSPELVTCPSSKQGNKCLDCRACWDKSTAVICYGKH